MLSVGLPASQATCVHAPPTANKIARLFQLRLQKIASTDTEGRVNCEQGSRSVD